MNKLIGGIILAVVAALVLAAITLFVTYVKYSNLGVQYESKLNAVWEENQVVLNTYTAKVQETAQVPDMFKNDLREIVEATFQGRYGEDGSKAVFQFIQEQNMQLDPQLYRQIQQVIESGRNDFQTSQKTLIDVKRAYEQQLGFFWSGMWLNIAGYPKMDLSKFKIVVLSEVAKKFESGEDSVIKLR